MDVDNGETFMTVADKMHDFSETFPDSGYALIFNQSPLYLLFHNLQFIGPNKISIISKSLAVLCNRILHDNWTFKLTNNIQTWK